MLGQVNSAFPVHTANIQELDDEERWQEISSEGYLESGFQT